jgi:hypothetical protein
LLSVLGRRRKQLSAFIPTTRIRRNDLANAIHSPS